MLTQLINQSIDAFGDMLHLINVLFIFVSLPRHNFFFYFRLTLMIRNQFSYPQLQFIV